MEFQGQLKMVMPVQQGVSQQGKQWQKCEAIVATTGGQYSNDVCLTFFGEKVGMLANCQQGATYKFSVDLNSREYNGRWYTDVNCWKIEPDASMQQPQFAPQTPQFRAMPPQAAQVPTAPQMQPQMAPQYAQRPQPAMRPQSPQMQPQQMPQPTPPPNFGPAPAQYRIGGVELQPRTQMFNDDPNGDNLPF